ncbi:hypothetical protein EDI_095910 [Entamoeba dispar SAW760]|uniref:Uncharacterized protein n=1 Tax=Entamoeba dispar (strain ATCC PRA-260 / SAW760) TaxID=370354 RepID=B0EI43_ENTDS|nr:uncharacterized protein EDI_095910 [Entamoeba dispar SAW760]EDR25803.1 hypothetical protein EDI_095910 [Entamoeba dispar SAW760]|eukprot:EDR25803.1 hypothetical protein EDI_095910 [Entamoeba dispar SAW760]
MRDAGCRSACPAICRPCTGRPASPSAAPAPRCCSPPAAAGLSTGGASCRRAGGRAVRGGLAGERRHAARAPDPLAVDAQRRRLATALRHPRRGLRGAAPCARPHAGQSHRRRPRPGQSRLPHASLHAALRAAGPVPQPRHRCGNPARTAHAGRGLAACHRPLPPARRRGTRGAIPAQCASAPDPRTRPRHRLRAADRRRRPRRRLRAAVLPVAESSAGSGHAAGPDADPSRGQHGRRRSRHAAGALDATVAGRGAAPRHPGAGPDGAVPDRRRRAFARLAAAAAGGAARAAGRGPGGQRGVDGCADGAAQAGARPDPVAGLRR